MWPSGERVSGGKRQGRGGQGTYGDRFSCAAKLLFFLGKLLFRQGERGAAGVHHLLLLVKVVFFDVVLDPERLVLGVRVERVLDGGEHKRAQVLREEV